MPRILIVEDEPDIAFGLREDLARNGYEVEVVGDGDAALARADGERWDLILLDVMLPRLDGYEVCRELRRRRNRTPIILLTAKVQEAEKVLGLELGADDYVTKPFSPRELRARIKAVLRRFDDGAAGVERFGDIEVDFDRAEVRRGGELVVVTALELQAAQGVPRAARPRAQPQPADRPRVGPWHERHGPRRGHPHPAPAPEGGAGACRAALHQGRARHWLPIRWMNRLSRPNLHAARIGARRPRRYAAGQEVEMTHARTRAHVGLLAAALALVIVALVPVAPHAQ